MFNSLIGSLWVRSFLSPSCFLQCLLATKPNGNQAVPTLIQIQHHKIIWHFWWMVLLKYFMQTIDTALEGIILLLCEPSQWKRIFCTTLTAASNRMEYFDTSSTGVINWIFIQVALAPSIEYFIQVALAPAIVYFIQVALPPSIEYFIQVALAPAIIYFIQVALPPSIQYFIQVALAPAMVYFGTTSTGAINWIFYTSSAATSNRLFMQVSLHAAINGIFERTNTIAIKWILWYK